MNILAIETATTVCAVALRAGDDVDARILDEDRRHTEALTPGIVRVLADHQLSVRDLDRIVVDRGPGLFTGLRVGLATAQALASAVGVDLVGVTSLECLAHSAASRGYRGALVALVDGRRGEVFAQSFEIADDVVVLTPAEVRRPLDVAIEWGTNGRPVLATGDGALRYADVLAPVPTMTLDDESVPSCRAAIALGAVRAPGEVSPLYLREADAVANFSTRQRPS